eukprot:CFRG7016T1
MTVRSLQFASVCWALSGVCGLSTQRAIPEPSTVDEWTTYYGQLLSTAGNLTVNGYESIGGIAELFELVECENTTLVEYLQGNANFSSVSQYSQRCSEACDKANDVCGGFAFNYLTSHPEKNECRLLNKYKSCSLRGFQCGGLCIASPGATMMQVLVKSSNPVCEADQYYGYDMAAELLTEIYGLGCRNMREAGDTCGDSTFSTEDMTNRREGCGSNLECYYVAPDSASRCLSKESINKIEQQQQEEDEATQKAKEAKLAEYSEMLKNVAISDFFVPYSSVLAIAKLDDGSYLEDGPFENYEQSIEVASLTGSIDYSQVEDFAGMCADACRAYDDTVGISCKGFGYVFKANSSSENMCRLLLNDTLYSFLGYGCGDELCVPGNGVMLKFYFKKEVECAQDQFYGYDLQLLSYESDRLENFGCRNQWRAGGYCGPDAFTPSTDISFGNSGCPKETMCSKDEESRYNYCVTL